MFIEFTIQNRTYLANIDEPIEISIPINRINGVSSFGIANATYSTYQDGSFVGSRNEGAGCNLETITFTPHGNSTHTECFGHISLEEHFVNDCIKDHFYLAMLKTFRLKREGEDDVLDFSDLSLVELSRFDALVIRVLPNTSDKLHKDYSGVNAPYIASSDMQKIVDAGIEHIILDLPSVDKEWDNGILASHHIFWQYPVNPRTTASITEFAFIPDEIVDGTYLLKLNIANFISDAAPSRPILYPLQLK